MTKTKDYIITNIGLGLLLRLPFADNGVLSGKRTFLVIDEEEHYILLLNVSSIRGKERKLLWPSNEEIQKYNPPFRVASMLKLNALYKVEKCAEISSCILCQNQSLDTNEFNRLRQKYYDYSSNNQILTSVTSATELRGYLTTP